MKKQRCSKAKSSLCRHVQARGRVALSLGCLLSVYGCGAEAHGEARAGGADIESEFVSAADFDAIAAEAGDDVLVNNIPGQIGSHTGYVERGTRYLRDGDIIAKVEITATEVRIATYVRGGGSRQHAVSISTSCEVVGQFYTRPILEAGDVVVARCTEEYPLERAMASIVDLAGLSDAQPPSDDGERAGADGERDTSDAPASAGPEARAPTSFEELIEVAGDAIIESASGGGAAGAHSGTLQRGTVYLRDGDVAAQVDVSAVEARVQTYVRGGGNQRHHVLISSACEVVPHYYKEQTFDAPGSLVASCPADYPLELASVSLVELAEEQTEHEVENDEASLDGQQGDEQAD